MKKIIRTAFTLMCLFMACAIGYSQQPLVYKTINDAAQQGDLADIKRHLQNGADVNAKDNYGWTPLMRAADRGDLSMIKYLAGKGADVKVSNQNGNTPLDIAVFNSNLDVVKYLVNKRADVNANNAHGYSPLGMAALMGKLDVVKCLVDNGADINAKDGIGMTPLKYAILKEHLDVVKYLTAKGAVLNSVILKAEQSQQLVEQAHVQFARQQAEKAKIAQQRAQEIELARVAKIGRERDEQAKAKFARQRAEQAERAQQQAKQAAIAQQQVSVQPQQKRQITPDISVAASDTTGYSQSYDIQFYKDVIAQAKVNINCWQKDIQLLDKKASKVRVKRKMWALIGQTKSVKACDSELAEIAERRETDIDLLAQDKKLAETFERILASQPSLEERRVRALETMADAQEQQRRIAVYKFIRGE